MQVANNAYYFENFSTNWGLKIEYCFLSLSKSNKLNDQFQFSQVKSPFWWEGNKPLDFSKKIWKLYA